MVFILMAFITQGLSAQSENGYFPNPYDPGRVQVELYMGGAIGAEGFGFRIGTNISYHGFEAGIETTFLPIFNFSDWTGSFGLWAGYDTGPVSFGYKYLVFWVNSPYSGLRSSERSPGHVLFLRSTFYDDRNQSYTTLPLEIGFSLKLPDFSRLMDNPEYTDPHWQNYQNLLVLVSLWTLEFFHHRILQ